MYKMQLDHFDPQSTQMVVIFLILFLWICLVSRILRTHAYLCFGYPNTNK